MFRCLPQHCIVAQYFSQPFLKPGRNVFTLLCSIFVDSGHDTYPEEVSFMLEVVFVLFGQCCDKLLIVTVILSSIEVQIVKFYSKINSY